jgi:ornithine carbamoyltransferase
MATIKQHFEPEAFVYRTATAFPQYNKADGTNFPVTGLYFDTAVEETAYLRFRALNYGTGNWTANINWYADSASSGGVTFGISLAAVTPNTDTQDVETKAFATETTVSDTHLGTTGQRSHDVSIALSNLDSVAADDWVVIRVARKVADAGDTMSGDCILTMFDLSYSDT